MKGNLRASIVSGLNSLKMFRCYNSSKFYWLLLFSCSSVFLGLSAVVAVAAPQQIAQQVGINRPTLKIGSQGERVSELQAALKLLGFYSGAVDGNYDEATANAVSQFKQTVGLSADGVVDAATWQRLFPNQPFVASTPTPTSTPSASFPVPTQAATTTNNRPQPRATTPSRSAPNQVVSTKPVPNRTNTKPVNNQVVKTKPVARTSTTSRANTNTTTRFSPTPPANRIAGVQYTAEGWPILRVGMRNAEVNKLQTRLSQLGFLKGSVDGYFGVLTEEAVKAAQKRYGINPDGVAGSATWEALLRRSPQRR